MLEKEIDMLLIKVNDSNFSKYDKYELCQKYMELEEMSDDIMDCLNGKKSDKLNECIEKMRKLNGHFYHSPYSKDYSDIFDFILHKMEKDDENDDEEKAILDMMFPNRYDDDFDEDSMSYDSVFRDDE